MAQVFPVFYPQINGHRYSHSSLKLRLNGNTIPILGLVSITYSDVLSPGRVNGTGPHKLGRTLGDHEPEASMELYELEFNNLIATVAPPLGDGYGEVPFELSCTYFDLGSPVIIDTLMGCRITRAETSSSQGPDPTVISCDLDVMVVKKGGASIVRALIPA